MEAATAKERQRKSQILSSERLTPLSVRSRTAPLQSRLCPGSIVIK